MASSEESATLAFPAGWVRCAWCKQVVPYRSPDLRQVRGRGGLVYMHAKCAHEAELAAWNKEPPMHGAD